MANTYLWVAPVQELSGALITFIKANYDRNKVVGGHFLFVGDHNDRRRIEEVFEDHPFYCGYDIDGFPNPHNMPNTPSHILEFFDWAYPNGY